MSKVTSKLQVTVPKVIADQYGIRPGDDILWVASGESVRILPARKRAEGLSTEDRLHLFDQATRRQARRQASKKQRTPKDRGWRREDLYDRDRTR